MSIYSHRETTRRLRAFERLESRELLSADAVGHLAAASHALAADAGGPTRGVQQFEISIAGTQVSYSPAGLPCDMQGAIYLDTAAGVSIASIGTYDETLQPIFAPVGPDGTPQFVGATGICTFDFNISMGGRSLMLGSIVAGDTALIEGVLPGGAMLVGSANSPITQATGICQGLTGSFSGQSEVRMGAVFDMRTTADFTVHDRWGVDMEETLTGLAIVNSAVGQGYVNDHWGKSLDRDEGGAAHAALAHLDWLADRYTAVDSVFASQTAPIGVVQIPS